MGGLIQKYASFISLPSYEDKDIVTLHEGQTPLIPLKHLSREFGVEIYAKCEGINPTGSFKDRGMTVAVTEAYQRGVKSVICASTGNTSASAAAYAARCGLDCYVLIPDGKIALGKLSQAMIYGAKVVAIPGNFDDALVMVKDVAAKNKQIALVNSVNPYRIEGQKTASFEIMDTLKKCPDYHILPVGNAGNITAYWKGYQEYIEKQSGKKYPVMLGFQAQGANPLVCGEKVDKPETIATAIRIGNPASWQGAIDARDQSRGDIQDCSDEEILQAQKLLASEEGIFVEPASAISIAGFLKYARQDFFKTGACVVCTVTGHGLKDPQTAIAQSEDVLKLEKKDELGDLFL